MRTDGDEFVMNRRYIRRFGTKSNNTHIQEPERAAYVMYPSLYVKTAPSILADAGSEGVLHVDEARCALADEYADDVEAHGIEVRLLLGQVTFCERAYGGLLAGGDRVEWATEAGSPAQLHLCENESVPVAQDQVQLAEAGAVVAIDELVALLRQVAQRELFAPRAGGTFAQGRTPA
jgi:hypothetical protein